MLDHAGFTMSRPAAWPWAAASLALLLAGGGPARAADLAEAEGFYRAGRYDEAAKLAAEEVAGGSWVERWHLVRLRSEMALGRHPEALASLENGLQRLPGSVALMLEGRQVYRFNGKDAEAKALLETIDSRISQAPQRYTGTAEGRVLLGRFLLIQGVDARKILDQCYDVAIKIRPDFVEPYLATAELALGKDDNALASTTLAKAPKSSGDDPRYHYLLARAFSVEDRGRSEKAIDEALKINPRHVESLLLRAEHRVDDERYDEASELIERSLAVNPHDPRAWSLRAVLAHLRSHPDREAEARDKALARWATNPEVDHRIGRELSRKYRFAEGSAHQEKALAIDPDYLPARVQLAQDYLRLGREEDGWKLAAEVFEADPYNVMAYNLTTLRDKLAGFRTLEGGGFVVRMDPREADLYGDRVLALLGKARKVLVEKYGATVPGPITVEIFPQKKEFAVRTFGLPGAEGFLGVCFGSVITANSPASQGESPSNWEGVLWHEFCHVVTLHKTKNKMPRWLSEGISVFEESRENPAWAGRFTPRYREMVLGEDFTPLSKLSSAFLNPKSGMHLQFAYFESYLAIDFLVGKFGLEALRGLLDDLGEGVTINESLPRRAGKSLEELDRDFAAFAKGKAGAVAPGMTWDEPKLPPDADSKAVEAWLKDHPKSFPGLRLLASKLVAEGDWSKAKEALMNLKAADPDYVEADNAYEGLAIVARKASDPAGEREALEALASKDGDAGPALLRLMELDEAESRWADLARDSSRMLAINPLIPAPHRALANASEHLNLDLDALASYKALAILDPADPAEGHFRRARILAKLNRPAEAKREALKALEEAPRFLDAHRLLLELAGPAPSPPGASPK